MLKLKTGSNTGSDTLTRDPTRSGQNRSPGDPVPSLFSDAKRPTLTQNSLPVLQKERLASRMSYMKLVVRSSQFNEGLLFCPFAESAATGRKSWAELERNSSVT